MSFFDKIKKGVGIEEENELRIKEKASSKANRVKKEQPRTAEKKRGAWPKPGGELTVDVYQTEDNLVVQSTIAGVAPGDLDVAFEQDMVIISGNRIKQAEGEGIKYFNQECYWGPFSRKIILPEEVDIHKAEASMKQGILTIKVPRTNKQKTRKITVMEE